MVVYDVVVVDDDHDDDDVWVMKTIFMNNPHHSEKLLFWVRRLAFDDLDII